MYIHIYIYYIYIIYIYIFKCICRYIYIADINFCESANLNISTICTRYQFSRLQENFKKFAGTFFTTE